MPGTSKKDAFAEARVKIGEGLIRSYFDRNGSYTDQNELFTLSPLRADKNVGSFHINLDNGTWYDHATSEGGDFISLVARSKGIKELEAAREIAGISDIPETKKAEKKKKKTPDPCVPIPETKKVKDAIQKRVRDKWCIEHWGEPKKIYQYRNIDGKWIFCVIRFEAGDKKSAIPFYRDIDGNWIAKTPEKLLPVPPFGIEKIKGNKNPVLIVEGEKCGQCEVEGYNVLSWFGGSAPGKVRKTNWRLLADREVIIWPDADSQRQKTSLELFPLDKQPGMKAAYAIKSELPQAKILDIYKYKPIDNNPDGWDLADCIDEEIDPLEVIRECLPENSIECIIDSHLTSKQFVADFYGDGNLEQNGGVYWEYDTSRHYWKIVMRRDIDANLQRWLERTGLQFAIASKVKIVGYINEVRSYLDRWSNGAIRGNPFKDAAVSPYIHCRNAVVEISKSGHEFIRREDHEEDYFRAMYPINCLDFEFQEKHSRDVDPAIDCPAFTFFIRGLIPAEITEGKSDDEAAKLEAETIDYISQILAYCISPIKPNEYFFGFHGEQNTGKTFFIRIIKALVGPEFCTERRIADMDNRFAAASLWGKKVFIEPDLKTREQLPEDFIKAYAGEQQITVERKNQEPIDGVRTSLALIFVSNYALRARGLEGLTRRFVFLPYRNKIKSTDRALFDKITGVAAKGSESGAMAGRVFDERSAILGLALQGWKQLCENNFEFSMPGWVLEEKAEWEISASSVNSFFRDSYPPEREETVVRSEVYQAYADYCKEEGKHSLGRNNFYEEFERLGRVSIVKSGGIVFFRIVSEIRREDEEIPF